jgi:hypothetical protein
MIGQSLSDHFYLEQKISNVDRIAGFLLLRAILNAGRRREIK